MAEEAGSLSATRGAWASPAAVPVLRAAPLVWVQSGGQWALECPAAVCLPGRPCCPPIVKTMVEIWNQNEIKMSGTERCLCAWDETLLSRWPLESGLPNHFLRQFLHTDRGRARIDGLRNVVVCGPDSQAWPLLGVAMKFLKFGSDVTQAGVPFTATGEERGLIRTPGAGLPRGSRAGDIQTQLERFQVHDPGVPDEMPGGQNLETTVASSRRADTTEKGSFLAFVKVAIKCDSSGRLNQDTFIQLTNDGSSDVLVNNFQVHDSHRDCPAIDITIVLTRDEPAYWEASTGGPKGVSPFTLLDPQGDPDTAPYHPDSWVLRGYVIAYAVNSVDEPIRWNHLTGVATVANSALRSAREYNPWSFRAWSAEEGQVLTGNPGQLEFDGVECDWALACLLLEFFAPAAVLRSSQGKTVIVDDTDLTLGAMFRDLTQY